MCAVQCLQHVVLTDILVLLLGAEVSLNDIEGLLVNLHVLMALQELDLVQPKYLLCRSKSMRAARELGSKRANRDYEYPTDNHRIGIGPSRCLHLLLPQPQDILQPIQSHLEIVLV